MIVRRDRFGLPIGSLAETDEQKRQRLADVRRSVLVYFKVVKAHFGQDEARVLFESAARRKRGRPGGSTAYDRDELLLGLYDACVPDKTLVRIVAERLHRWRPDKMGNSPMAIARHLRRLLTNRLRRHAVFAAELEAYRAAHGQYPGLLGDLIEFDTRLNSFVMPSVGHKIGII
jgi:hypothetical protein